MKKLFFSTAILLMGFQLTQAQCPPAGDITFDSQISIDAFLLAYPNCTKIDGNVTIEGADIWNFAGLSRITEITNNLTIQNNPILPFFSWLENLTTLGGGLIVQDNKILESFQGLSGLKSVDSVIIWSNPALIDIAGTESGHEGFISLTSVKGDLWIDSNVKLTSLTGLDNVASIGGSLGIDSNVKLTSLTGLDKVTSIGGNLMIAINTELTSLTGLDSVASIGGYIYIADNNVLTEIDGIINIDPATIKSQNACCKDLNILYNPQLSLCAPTICGMLTYPGLKADIHDNYTDCNSITEVETACTPPPCSHLTSPVADATDVKVNSNISWSVSTDAIGYWLTVGTTSGGTEIIDTDMGNVTSWDPPSDFDSGATIFVNISPFNAAQIGDYCAEESFTIEDGSTNISEFEKESVVKVYPNPAKHNLYLKFNKEVLYNYFDFKIDIYSVTGQKVISIPQLSDKIDIKTLNEGIYVIMISTGKETISRKIAVVK